jgi:uncharacterized protein
MTPKLDQFMELARRAGHVTIATADARGVPHVASAMHVAQQGGRLLVSEWFCPGTVANLAENPQVSIVAWDAEVDEGLQVIGVVEQVEDFAVMDGYEPGQAAALPQVQRRLIVAPERVLRFTQAPHSDVEGAETADEIRMTNR